MARWRGEALRAAERTQGRLRWQPDLKFDSLLDSADELSGRWARQFAAGSADWVHIAAARRVHLHSNIDEFWTCDAQQGQSAKAVGLQVRLFSL